VGSGRSAAGIVLALSIVALAGGAPAVDALREGLARATGTPMACSFRTRTGYDCLGCGGTRAFGHVARGRLYQGFRWNPLGAMIGLCAWGFALGALVALARGRGYARTLGLAAAAALVAVALTFVVHAVTWWRALPPRVGLW
jgi:hypothetical protein